MPTTSPSAPTASRPSCAFAFFTSWISRNDVECWRRWLESRSVGRSSNTAILIHQSKPSSARSCHGSLETKGASVGRSPTSMMNCIDVDSLRTATISSVDGSLAAFSLRPVTARCPTSSTIRDCAASILNLERHRHYTLKMATQERDVEMVSVTHVVDTASMEETSDPVLSGRDSEGESALARLTNEVNIPGVSVSIESPENAPPTFAASDWDTDSVVGEILARVLERNSMTPIRAYPKGKRSATRVPALRCDRLTAATWTFLPKRSGICRRFVATLGKRRISVSGSHGGNTSLCIVTFRDLDCACSMSAARMCLSA